MLLPGLDGTGRLFEPFLKVLPPSIVPQVIAYPRGKPLGYDDLFEFVAPQLPTGRPFVLLGESFGGPLAIRLAASRPPGLAGLVLCGTFVRNPHPWAPRWSAWFVSPWQFRLRPLVWWGRKVLGRGASDHLREQVALADAEAGPLALAQRLREVLRVDVSRELPKVTVPILSLAATHDWIVPSWNSRQIANIARSTEGPAPRSFRSTALDTGHLILQTRPTEAVAAIEEFVRTLA